MDAPARTVFDVVTDFLANRPTDAELLAYEIPPEQQARLDELVAIDTNSRLSAAQREELGDYRFVEDVMARVKAKIKQRLAKQQDESSGETETESTQDATQDEENES